MNKGIVLVHPACTRNVVTPPRPLRGRPWEEAFFVCDLRDDGCKVRHGRTPWEPGATESNAPMEPGDGPPGSDAWAGQWGPAPMFLKHNNDQKKKKKRWRSLQWASSHAL